MKTIILKYNQALTDEKRLELERIYSEKLKVNVVILDVRFNGEIVVL
ncbi:hypothetical protein [Lysinibacillus sphaericus]